MQKQVSHTAFGVLAARAIYSVAPKQRKIIDDAYAEHLLPEKFEHLRVALKYAKRFPYLYYILYVASLVNARSGISTMALRHRYIDETISRFAKEQNIQQIVILGAGFDARAHRLDIPNINYIEVDEAATQDYKKQQLSTLPLSVNNDVKYVAIDFMKPWADNKALHEAINGKATLFIWEGVSYYLDEQAITYTLKTLKSLSNKTSYLIFDCLPKDITNTESTDPHILRVQNKVREMGEPMLWGCDKEDISDLLKQHEYDVHKVSTIHEYAEELRKINMRIERKPWHHYMYMVTATIND